MKVVFVSGPASMRSVSQSVWLSLVLDGGSLDYITTSLMPQNSQQEGPCCSGGRTIKASFRQLQLQNDTKGSEHHQAHKQWKDLRSKLEHVADI